jgi:hypothetical protein
MSTLREDCPIFALPPSMGLTSSRGYKSPVRLRPSYNARITNCRQKRGVLPTILPGWVDRSPQLQPPRQQRVGCVATIATGNFAARPRCFAPQAVVPAPPLPSPIGPWLRYRPTPGVGRHGRMFSTLIRKNWPHIPLTAGAVEQ